jgi:hypothetical protein
MNSNNMEKTLVAIESIFADLRLNLIDLEELTKLKDTIVLFMRDKTE